MSTPLSSIRRRLKATSHLHLGYIIYGLPALIVIGRLALFAIAEPYYEADTALLVNKLIETVRGCLQNLRAECTHAGPLPLFQYVPTLLLKYLGWADTSILHFFAYASFLSFIASLLLIFRTLKKRAPLHLAVAGVLVMMSGALLWYSHSTFAEMCAAFLTLAFVASCLLRLPGWLTAGLLVLAGSTKETALPFLLLLGLACLLPEIINNFGAVKRQALSLALGAMASAGLTILFNYFRFRTFYNRDYLTDILLVPSWRIQLDFFLGIWFSPNGGLLFFWPSFTFLYFALIGLLIFQSLRKGRGAEEERSSKGKRERLVFYLPVLVVSASLFLLTVGFSRWYAPFGWVAWGPRLLLPWIPAVSLMLLYFYAAQFTSILTALFGGTYRFALTCTAFVLASIPQFAILFRHQVLGGIFGPNPDCPRSPIIQESVQYYYHCMHTYIWPRRLIFPELYAVAFRGDASRSTIFYVLMLVVGCVWIRRRLTGSRSTPASAGWIVTLRDAMEPLWVAGLALLCLFIGSLFNLEGETFDWTEYLLLATIFPLLLITLSLAERFRPSLAGTLSNTRFGLAAFLVLLPIFTLRYKIKYVLIASLVQWLMTSQLLRRSADAQAIDTSDFKTKAIRAFPLIFVILMSWVAATRYIWWALYEVFILGSMLAFIVFILSLLVVMLSLYDQTPALEDERRNALRRIGDTLAILFIAMVSVRTDHIFGLGEIHHWAFFTGPAQMVRQGGWLLWDVPSQYGFLVTLTLAWLPTKTAWQSLFLVNSLFNFLIALMIFYLFRALRPGLVNLCFALAVTLASVFFRSGLAPYFESPSHLPNTGGLRFFWAFALVAILFREYRRGARSRTHASTLWAGCVVWLIGTLWSAESAAYCFATWLPAYALLVWRRVGGSEAAGGSFKTRLRASARWLLLPLVLLLAVVILITAFYFIRLGHGPDWYSFIEYAQAYRGGFATVPIDLNGGVWVMVIIFCALATMAAYFLRENIESAALPLIMGAGGALWATASYFVSRSHPNNIHNLGAVLCGVMGLVLYLLVRERRDEWWASLVKASFVPILTIVLVAVFANKHAVTDYIFAPQASYVQIERLIPISDPGIDNLLNSAGVKPDSPLVYIGPNEVLILSAWTFTEGDRKEVLTTYRSWLPVPVYSLAPLPEERREVYLSRFANRMGAGGWLIEFKMDKPLFPWFSEYLKLHYTPGRTFENDNWRLTWYDYKG